MQACNFSKGTRVTMLKTRAEYSMTAACRIILLRQHSTLVHYAMPAHQAVPCCVMLPPVVW